MKKENIIDLSNEKEQAKIILSPNNNFDIYIEGIPFPIISYKDKEIAFSKSLLSSSEYIYLAQQNKKEIDSFQKQHKVNNDTSKNYILNQKLLLWELYIVKYQLEILNGTDIYEILDNIYEEDTYEYEFYTSALYKAYYELETIGFINTHGKTLKIEKINKIALLQIDRF